MERKEKHLALILQNRIEVAIRLYLLLPLLVPGYVATFIVFHDRSNVSFRQLPWILLLRSESKHVYDRETRIGYLDRRLSTIGETKMHDCPRNSIQA